MPKGIALLSRAVFTPYEYNEHIDLNSAIEYHAYGGGYKNFLENVTGTIEVGKKADLIVLNEDVFSKRNKSPRDTEVVMTLFDSRVIHSS